MEGLGRLPGDRDMVDYVVKGIRRNFWVGFDYSSQTCKKAAQNMKSALEKPEIVSIIWRRGVQRAEWYIGPIEPGKFPMVHVSHLG